MNLRMAMCLASEDDVKTHSVPLSEQSMLSTQLLSVGYSSHYIYTIYTAHPSIDNTVFLN